MSKPLPFFRKLQSRLWKALCGELRRAGSWFWTLPWVPCGQTLRSSWALGVPVRAGLRRDGGCSSHRGWGTARLCVLLLASKTPGAGGLIWVLELCPNSSGTSPWSQGGLGCPGRGTFGISRTHLHTLTPGRKLGCLPPDPAFSPG